jgi:GNAT superfamily N-acetyltransferase
MNVSILPLDESGLPALLRMWREYQEFYQVNDIDERRNLEHVTQILASPGLGCIHLAIADGVPVGFSTVYYTFASTRACKVALLNDLYVVPAKRRGGIGRALIEQALEQARREGIRFVRWSTAASNVDAQRLYDAYGEPTLWKMYSVDVSKRTKH